MKKKYFFILALFSVAGFCQTGIYSGQMAACDAQVSNFLDEYGIPGASVAITKNGKLVYSRSFGHADLQGMEETQPYKMFRIASISKPLTAVGIMKMIENGQISLDDHVFGPGGLLENHWYLSSAAITDDRIYDVTVRMLLEHNAGWDRDIDCFPDPASPYPWYFGGCDPIVVPLHVTATLGEPNPVTEEHLIAFLLEKGLEHDPGTTYAYSNIGYLMLGEIIEEVSGMGYEEWMKQEILHPLGIYDMHIGKTLLSEKAEREAEYVGNNYVTYSLYNDGTYVPWEYGGYNIAAMDAHGGWIATARDLLRLTVAVDGFATKPDILSAGTIATMVEPSDPNSWYAKGWSVNTANNWWHSGALDGSATYLVRSNSGYTWAILLNKRIIDASENAFWGDLDDLGWNCLAAISAYPTYDLFDSPLQPAKNLTAANVTTTSLDLNWTNGDGTSRIVVVKPVEGAEPVLFSSYPLDGEEYVGNALFSSAEQLADGTSIVYTGTGSSVSVTGLTAGVTYAIRVYESKKSTGNGNNMLYLLGQPAQLIQTTTLGIADLAQSSIKVFPNPASAEITISNPEGLDLVSATLTDTNGRVVYVVSQFAPESKIDVRSLSNGIYFLCINTAQGKFITKIMKE